MKNKEKVELEFAEIFCRYVNKRFSYDYCVISGNKECIPANYPDIDVVLKSLNGRESLFLQLRRDISYVEIIDIDRERTPLFSCESIAFAITDKSIKYRNQKKNIKNTILLIQGGGIPYSEMKIWTFDVGIPRDTFRGIYYLSPRGLVNKEFVLPILDGLKIIER